MKIGLAFFCVILLTNQQTDGVKKKTKKNVLGGNKSLVAVSVTTVPDKTGHYITADQFNVTSRSVWDLLLFSPALQAQMKWSGGTS